MITVLHVFVGFQGLRMYEAFQIGPSEALATAKTGSIAGFVECFGEPAIQNPEAASFVQVLEAR